MNSSISAKKLEKLLNIKTATIKLYLCRAELNHIIYAKDFFYNISEKDIEFLKQITQKGKKYKSAVIDKTDKASLKLYTDFQLEYLKKQLETDCELKKNQLENVKKEIKERNERIKN